MTPDSGVRDRGYRLRAGDWRAVFALDDRGLIVARIFRRREGYAWLERLDAALEAPAEKGR